MTSPDDPHTTPGGPAGPPPPRGGGSADAPGTPQPGPPQPPQYGGSGGTGYGASGHGDSAHGGPQQPGPQQPGPQFGGHHTPYGPHTQYGAPGHQQPPSQRLSPDSERSWAIASHLSGFIAAYVALGFLGPLVCMLVIGDRSPYARRQAVEALNFNLSWLIYIAVSGVLSFVLIGLPLLAGLAIAYVILVVMAAMAASRGEEYRYPLTIRMVS